MGTTTDLILPETAAVALLDEAEAALAEVKTPDNADELWRRVQAVEEAARLARVADATVAALTRVRLRAKRRWGELLPEKEPGKRSDLLPTETGSSLADRIQQHRARKLAAVPEQIFTAALAGDDPDKAPSEASVLRHVDSGTAQRIVASGAAGASGTKGTPTRWRFKR